MTPEEFKNKVIDRAPLEEALRRLENTLQPLSYPHTPARKTDPVGDYYDDGIRFCDLIVLRDALK